MAPVGVLLHDLINADVEGFVGVTSDTSHLVYSEFGSRHRLPGGNLG